MIYKLLNQAAVSHSLDFLFIYYYLFIKVKAALRHCQCHTTRFQINHRQV